MERKQYTRRKVGDNVNGAVLIERINGRLWKMRCSCGETFIAQPSDSKGVCRKCAMIKLSEERTKHGESPKKGKQNASKLYSVWLNMRSRCYNPKNKKYKDYGGRGISICSDWDDFLNFKRWSLEKGFDESLTIDRIDNNGNYCPENCRWINQKEQMRNTRVNHLLTYNGVTKTMAEWSEITGIKYHTLKQRINKYGYSVERALTTPVLKHPECVDTPWKKEDKHEAD